MPRLPFLLGLLAVPPLLGQGEPIAAPCSAESLRSLDFWIGSWTVTDPQGLDTTVAVYNLDTTKQPDPSLFRIDYTRDIR